MKKPRRRPAPQSISELPQVPAVYALYGSRGRNLYVAYVGITASLRTRMQQHLVNRDSSVSVGTSAAGLNPGYVTELRWWEHKLFKKKIDREAAELIAYEVHEPILRSRGNISASALRLSKREDFKAEMEAHLAPENAAGHLILPTLEQALTRLADHERRLAALEERLKAERRR